MTLYTDVKTISTLVNQVGLTEVLGHLVHNLEKDYIKWLEFDKSARTAAHSDVGVIELMPIANDDKYAFKYVNGHPENHQKNLSTVMAFGVLAEVDTGYPILLSELTLTTALRTAATSVMAAKQLARKDSTTMALIGCGAQSEFQAIAFHTLLGIKEIRFFDTDPKAMDKFKANLEAYTELTLVACSSSKDATQGVDIITTVTADKKYATIITPAMVSAGMHINGVGGDCPGKTEIALEVLLQSDIFVEYEPQSRVEGDIQQLPSEHQVTELWQVISEKQPGRTYEEQITFFDSVGFAIEDYSALRLMYQLATQHGLGEQIDLVPSVNNPKNLFSLLNNVN